MTIHNVYIGDLQDPKFSWDDGDWDSNVPSRVSEMFPPANVELFFEVIHLIKDGKLEGKQTDFGGWVAKVRKDQILQLISFWYDADPYQSEFEAHLQGWWKKFRDSISKLEDDKVYGLVATEL